MPHDLIAMITTNDPAVRNRSLDGFCRTADVAALRDATRALDAFRRQSENLYERVRSVATSGCSAWAIRPTIRWRSFRP